MHPFFFIAFMCRVARGCPWPLSPMDQSEATDHAVMSELTELAQTSPEGKHAHAYIK